MAFNPSYTMLLDINKDNIEERVVRLINDGDNDTFLLWYKIPESDQRLFDKMMSLYGETGPAFTDAEAAVNLVFSGDVSGEDVTFSNLVTPLTLKITTTVDDELVEYIVDYVPTVDEEEGPPTSFAAIADDITNVIGNIVDGSISISATFSTDRIVIEFADSDPNDSIKVLSSGLFNTTEFPIAYIQYVPPAANIVAAMRATYTHTNVTYFDYFKPYILKQETVIRAIPKREYIDGDQVSKRIIITDLPNGDPEEAGVLYYDPEDDMLKVSTGPHE